MLLIIIYQPERGANIVFQKRFQNWQEMKNNMIDPVTQESTKANFVPCRM